MSIAEAARAANFLDNLKNLRSAIERGTLGKEIDSSSDSGISLEDTSSSRDEDRFESNLGHPSVQTFSVDIQNGDLGKSGKRTMVRRSKSLAKQRKSKRSRKLPAKNPLRKSSSLTLSSVGKLSAMYVRSHDSSSESLTSLSRTSPHAHDTISTYSERLRSIDEQSPPRCTNPMFFVEKPQYDVDSQITSSTVDTPHSRLEDAWELLKEAKKYTHSIPDSNSPPRDFRAAQPFFSSTAPPPPTTKRRPSIPPLATSGLHAHTKHSSSPNTSHSIDASEDDDDSTSLTERHTIARTKSQINDLKKIGATQSLKSFIYDDPHDSHSHSDDDALSLNTDDILTTATSMTQRSTMTAHTDKLTVMSDISSHSYTTQGSAAMSPLINLHNTLLSPLSMQAHPSAFNRHPLALASSPGGAAALLQRHRTAMPQVSESASEASTHLISELSSLNGSTRTTRRKRAKSSRRTKSMKRSSGTLVKRDSQRRGQSVAHSIKSSSSTALFLNRMILPTKTVLKLYRKGKISFVDGHSQELKRVTYNGSVVNIVPDQVALLVLERQKLQLRERTQRMKDAKDRASQLNKFSAKYIKCMKRKIPKEEGVLYYVNQSITAMVRGWVVRWRLRRMKEAAVRIQRWYRDMLPQHRAFRSHFRRVVEMKLQSRLVIFTQKHLRTYHTMMRTYRKVMATAMHPVQCCARTILAQRNCLRQLDRVLETQNAIRRFLVLHCYEVQLLDEKLTFIKLAVLRKYEKLLAPYSRRALFCYRTRFNSKKSYSIALREYKYIEARSQLFMERKTYHHHLQFVVTKMLKHTKNPNFSKIVRNVFEEDVRQEKISSLNLLARMLIRLRRVRRGKRPTHKRHPAALRPKSPVQKNSLQDPPQKKQSSKKEMDIEKLLVRMAPNMFSDQYGVQRANWGGLIIYSFVIHDLITPKTRFDKNDINLRFMLDRKSTHKIPYNKI